MLFKEVLATFVWNHGIIPFFHSFIRYTSFLTHPFCYIGCPKTKFLPFTVIPIECRLTLSLGNYWALLSKFFWVPFYFCLTNKLKRVNMYNNNIKLYEIKLLNFFGLILTELFKRVFILFKFKYKFSWCSYQAIKRIPQFCQLSWNT